MKQHLINFILITLFFHYNLQAQTPSMTTNDFEKAHPIQISHLDIHAQIIGAIALTEVSITFYNTSEQFTYDDRILLPLPKAAKIMSYATVMDNSTREAVSVPRDQALEIQEELFTHTSGSTIVLKKREDNYRIQITAPRKKEPSISSFYDNKSKYVTLKYTYEEELNKVDNNKIIYQFPFEVLRPIENLDFKITVHHADSSLLIDPFLNPEMSFSKTANSYESKLTKTNYTPTESLSILIPQKDLDSYVVTQKNIDESYSFLINTTLNNPAPIKEWKKTGILWDNSLRGLKRNIADELKLLETLITEQQNLTIQVALLNTKMGQPKSFIIHSGVWDELKNYLENITYDGAADYSQIQVKKIEANEILFFTDGIAPFGSKDFSSAVPIHTINSSDNADLLTLQRISHNSGGTFINLVSTPLDQAWKRLRHEPLQYLGIKEQRDFRDVHPVFSNLNSQNITLVGKAKDNTVQDITLVLKYPNKKSFEHKLTLNYTTTPFNISKIWAQKKLAHLNLNLQKHFKEIEQLGVQFNILTPNTSLIILDEPENYIRYNINPPESQKKAYDALKLNTNIQKEVKKGFADAAIQYQEKLQNWSLLAESKILKKPFISNETRTITGIVTYEEDDHSYTTAPFATVSILGSEANTTTDINGHYSIETDLINPTLIFEYMGQETQKITLKNQNSLDVTLVKEQDSEIYIISYESIDLKRRTSKTRSIRTLRNSDMQSPLFTSPPQEVARHPTEINTYLQEINTSNSPYQTYLNLRETYYNTPQFYLDVADFFYEQKNREKAFLILSNLTALDVENSGLFKLVLYKLMEYGFYEKELFISEEILKWRPMDLQSYRDHALTLLDNDKPKQALQVLEKALEKNFYEKNYRYNKETEKIIATEISNIQTRSAKGKINSLFKSDSDLLVDIRIVLNWNTKDAYIDNCWIQPPFSNPYQFTSSPKDMNFDTEQIQNGYGLKQFLIKKANPGTYKIVITANRNYFSWYYLPTIIMAEVFLNYGSDRQERKLITMTARKPFQNGSPQFVGEFEFK